MKDNNQNNLEQMRLQYLAVYCHMTICNGIRNNAERIENEQQLVLDEIYDKVSTEVNEALNKTLDSLEKMGEEPPKLLDMDGNEIQDDLKPGGIITP